MSYTYSHLENELDSVFLDPEFRISFYRAGRAAITTKDMALVVNNNLALPAVQAAVNWEVFTPQEVGQQLYDRLVIDRYSWDAIRNDGLVQAIAKAIRESDPSLPSVYYLTNTEEAVALAASIPELQALLRTNSYVKHAWRQIVTDALEAIAIGHI